MVNEVIEELKIDAKKYIESKIRRNRWHIGIYLLFIAFIVSLWVINKQCTTIPLLLSNIIGVFLFIVSLVIMRLINHSFFDTLLFRKKAVRKYEQEFYNKEN